MTPLFLLLGLVGLLFLLAYLPDLLAKVLDPRNERIIRDHCESLGLNDVSLKAWPNHYGVYYRHAGKKLYAKCRVTKGNVVWLGHAPETD